MTTTLTIRVEFTSDRWQTGTLRLLNREGKTIAGPFRALGKSDSKRAKKEGNVARDPKCKYGDTPTGTYRVPRTVKTGAGTNYPVDNYGPDAAIVLNPESGNALTAKQNGRMGLLIHSGASGAGGRLRATHGCIRLSNADMRQLLEAISQASTSISAFRCEAVDISVTVGEDSDDDAGLGMQDPPYGIEALLAPQPLPWP